MDNVTMGEVQIVGGVSSQKFLVQHYLGLAVQCVCGSKCIVVKLKYTFHNKYTFKLLCSN